MTGCTSLCCSVGGLRDSAVTTDRERGQSPVCPLWWIAGRCAHTRDLVSSRDSRKRAGIRGASTVRLRRGFESRWGPCRQNHILAVQL